MGEVIDAQREKIRAMVSNIYDMQKMRISCGNRLAASFMELGKKSRERTQESVRAEKDEAEKETNSIISKVMGEYTRISDTFAAQAAGKRVTDLKITKALENGELTGKLELIGSVYEYRLAENYNMMLKTEEQANSALATEVKKHPMWQQFFESVIGCGPLMAAVCISYFDVSVARHPASFWKYAGLDVVDGEGRGRKHTEIVEYIDKEGSIKTKNGITFNPTLKTKLLGVLAPCIIKLSREKKEAGSTESGRPIGYAKVYYDYKNRLDNKVDYYKLIHAIVGNRQSLTASEMESILPRVSSIWQEYRHKDVVDVCVESAKNTVIIVLTTDDGNKANVYPELYTPGHKHNMAMRYMIKQLVRDLWIKWRTHEGYDIGNPYYEVAKLGYKPHGFNG